MNFWKKISKTNNGTFDKKNEILKVEKIAYFAADGSYTKIFLKDGTYKIISKNIGEFEKTLNPELFVRIHHKYIINLEMLIDIHKTDGNYCNLEGGHRVSISMRKLDKLYQILNK